MSIDFESRALQSPGSLYRIYGEMMKRAKVISIVFFLFCGTSAVAADTPDSLTAITENNWRVHPRIVEIRKIYEEIRKALDNKSLTYLEKDFSKLPRSCRGTYPIEKLAVAYDKKGNVRLYIHAQRISHDDLQTDEYYYDQNGKLRFVFMTNKSDVYAKIENRVYVSTTGKVFWDVKKEAKEITYGEITSDPYQIKELTNKGIKERIEKTEVTCEE